MKQINWKKVLWVGILVALSVSIGASIEGEKIYRSLFTGFMFVLLYSVSMISYLQGQKDILKEELEEVKDYE